jgi:protein gp37
MAKQSKIAWCDGTVNFWIGCTKVSAGCKNCYAETFAVRTGRDVWGPKGGREIGKAAYRDPIKWNDHPFVECEVCSWRGEVGGRGDPVRCPGCDHPLASTGHPVRRRVFTNSLSDFFEARPDLIDPRAKALEILEATPNIDWLVLTKRIHLAAWMTPSIWSKGWPSNIWLGTSVENQATADERVPDLLAIPALIRWLSVEPQIGPVTLTRIPWTEPEGFLNVGDHQGFYINALHGRGSDAGHARRIEWVIQGGESGARHRPFDIEWARSLSAECREAGVAYFLKQLGGHPDKRHDLEDFPPDLRIREYPASAAANPVYRAHVHGSV